MVFWYSLKNFNKHDDYHLVVKVPLLFACWHMTESMMEQFNYRAVILCLNHNGMKQFEEWYLSHFTGTEGAY